MFIFGCSRSRCGGVIESVGGFGSVGARRVCVLVLIVWFVFFRFRIRLRRGGRGLWAFIVSFLYREEVVFSLLSGVLFIRDFSFRSVSCVTSSFIRCICGLASSGC